MKPIKEYVFKDYAGSREKPSYRDSTRNHLVYLLADDFQQDVKNSLYLQIAGNPSFPLSDSVSLYVEIFSAQPCSIIGVLKNIMDAGNRLAYSDDCHVKSVLIKKTHWNKKSDLVKMKILDGYSIDSIFEVPDDFQQYKILDCDVETIIESNYLPYPPGDSAEKGIIKKRLTREVFIWHQVTSDFPEKLTEGSTGLSFEVSTSNNHCDIDNLLMTYVYSMEGKVFHNLIDIDILHAKKTVISAPEQEQDKCKIYELERKGEPTM